MEEKLTIWERIKNGLKRVGDFFTGLSNIASYGAETTAVNKALESFGRQMAEIDKSIKEHATATTALTSQITTLNGEIAKIKDGLQMELFGSLQALHIRLKEQHYATLDQKREAHLYYTQIHNLGKDGWSQRYYDEIIAMPESREEYWKTLAQQPPQPPQQ